MLNTVTFQGRLTADPELRYTPRGTPLCNFRVAQNVRTAEGTDDRAVFVSVTAWKGWAENLVKTARKGSVVTVSGRLEQEEWTEEGTGKKRSKIKIQAREVYHVEPVYAEDRDAGDGNDRDPVEVGAPEEGAGPPDESEIPY